MKSLIIFALLIISSGCSVEKLTLINSDLNEFMVVSVEPLKHAYVTLYNKKTNSRNKYLIGKRCYKLRESPNSKIGKVFNFTQEIYRNDETGNTYSRINNKELRAVFCD
jgi:hypothetical protein